MAAIRGRVDRPGQGSRAKGDGRKTRLGQKDCRGDHGEEERRTGRQVKSRRKLRRNRWGGCQDKDETQYVDVLEIPLVVSAETAARVQIFNDIKKVKSDL